MKRSSSQSAIATLTIALAVLGAAPVDARVTKPFKITGGGIAPLGLRPPGEVTPHTIGGTATHLGRHTGQGSFELLSLDFVTFTGTFASVDPCEFIAANGDKLVCHYGRTDKGAAELGSYELTIVDVTDGGDLIVEALFIAEFVPQPECTGRFAGATGSWIMFAQTEPFVFGASDPTAYFWEGDGKLTFRKPKK